jgi:uncharacterized delta-60 repeat protein
MLKPWTLHVGILLVLIAVLSLQGLRPDSGNESSHTVQSGSQDSRKKLSPSGFSPDLQADVFSAFTAWKNEAPASPAERARWIDAGIQWAKARIASLALLARQQPDRAAARMMSLAELAELPDQVREFCEKPVSGIGSTDLQWLTGNSAESEISCSHRSIAHLHGQVWRMNGRKYQEAQTPRANVPIDGYLIDGELLASHEPVRRLDATNLAAAKKSYPIGNSDQLDPVTGNPASAEHAALIGGKIYQFENAGTIDHVIATLTAADKQAEVAKTHTPDHGFRWLQADGGSYHPENPPVEPTPFLTNQVDVLFIRVSFTDINPAVATKTELETALSATNTSIQNYSYGAASITGTVSTSVYSLGVSTSYSNNANGSQNLLTAARNAASANYVLSNYDVVAVYFPALSGSDFNYAGLASVGGSDHWLNGLTNQTSLISVLVHEFGHNYGLFHANYWDPARQIAGAYEDPAASSLEYGDIFDRMGSGSTVSSGYFNPFSTTRLNWLPAGKTIQPTADGTYRIYRFDSPTALNNPLLALRVPMGGSEYWWVGLRKLYPSIATSAYVVAEGLYASRSNLIDMTPGSQSPESNDRSDAPLPLNGTYYSATHGVRFRTLASGGTAPNEWIDVRVEFDSRLQFASTALQIDESSGSAVLTLSRSNGSAGTASITYTTANGTATAGNDYLASTGTVTWADGDATDKKILIPIRPDAISDSGETFTVTLSNPSGAALVSTQATATITLRDAGQLLTDFTSSFFNTTVGTIAPLSSGKVIIGGTFTSGFSGNITRLNANGSQDATFIKGTGFNGEVNSIVQLPDGSLIVGGAFTSYNSATCNRIAKLSADGALDTTFVSNTAGGAGNSSVNCIAIDSNGQIVVAGGFTTFSGNPALGIVRLSPSGVRETTTTFSASGTPTNCNVYGMIAQSDGKIMLTGIIYNGSSPTRSGAVRLNADGSRDTTFNSNNGLHSISGINFIRNGYAIARQPDGKYIIGGFFSAYNGNPVSNLVRIQTDGSYDNTFAPPAIGSDIYALLALPDGGLLVAGNFTTPANRLIKLNANGAVDNTFQPGTGPGGTLYTLTRGPDGAVWLGGNFFTYNGTSVWPVVKIAGGSTPYQLWAAGQFTSTQINAGTTDPTDDPDNDGINNLAEMAMGSSPIIAGPNSFSTLAGSNQLVNSSSNQYLQASFARSAAQSGAWIAAQFSNDLDTWSPANPLPSNNLIYDIIEQSPTRFTVRDKTPVNNALPRRFVRFVVLLPQ